MVWPNQGLAHRPVAMGRRGAVASAHPLASVAGLRVLQAGGNAVDAAVATAAALNVAEPYMSGMGGSGYMLLYTAADRKLQVLDYIGPSSRNAHFDRFGSEQEKDYGPKAPLVPTALSGWLTAHEQFGSLDLGSVFAPAIEYATGGVPLTVKNAFYYDYAFNAGNLTDRTMSVFMAGGRAPFAGEVVKQEALAATMQAIVKDGQESFYRGALAERIVSAIQEAGGFIDAEDMAAYRPVWKEPASVDYRGYTVSSPPPSCSGWEYLSSLNLLNGIDVRIDGSEQRGQASYICRDVQTFSRRQDRLHHQSMSRSRRSAFGRLRGRAASVDRSRSGRNQRRGSVSGTSNGRNGSAGRAFTGSEGVHDTF